MPFILQSLIRKIYPTENDIGKFPSDGGKGTEENSVIIARATGLNGVIPNLDANENNTNIAGLEVYFAGSNNFKITRGRAIIDGYLVELDTTGGDIEFDINGDKLSAPLSDKGVNAGDENPITKYVVLLKLLDEQKNGNVDYKKTLQIDFARLDDNKTYLGSIIGYRNLAIGLISVDTTTIIETHDIRFSPSSQLVMTEVMVASFSPLSIYPNKYTLKWNNRGSFIHLMHNGFSQLTMTVRFSVHNYPFLPPYPISITLNSTITLKGAAGVITVNPSFIVAINPVIHADAITDLRVNVNFGNSWLIPYTDTQLISIEMEFIPDIIVAQATLEVIGASIKNFQS